MTNDKYYLKYFQIHTGTMSLAELNSLVKEKEKEKNMMKQEILRRKNENGLLVEEHMRREMNNNTINILLEKADQSTNPKVRELAAKLKALQQLNNE